MGEQVKFFQEDGTEVLQDLEPIPALSPEEISVDFPTGAFWAAVTMVLGVILLISSCFVGSLYVIFD